MPAPKDPVKRKEWIEKISKSKSSKNHPLYRKKQKQLTKDKISKSSIGKHVGEKNSLWKGKEYQGKRGRWFIWIDNIKYLRSRYTSEQYLNRKLNNVEIVHHINEDPSDDRPENLYVFPNQSSHAKHHALKNSPMLTSNLI